jgi:hypothetical protein
MNNIIDFSLYQKKKESEKIQPDHTEPSEDLGIAIQTLIQQLRKATGNR